MGRQAMGSKLPEDGDKGEDCRGEAIIKVQIMLLCSLGLAAELGYSVLAAYAVPLLVAAGLNLKFASLSLALSPALVVVTLGYVGHGSDHCQCSWGRRRPFILFFSALICIGFGATPFAPYLSTVNKEAAIALTIVGVFVSLYSLVIYIPIRAYQMDCVPPKQIQNSNFVFTIFSGIGATLGYIVSALDWAKVLNRDVNIVNEAQGVCIVTVAVTIVCTICGLCSFKEEAYKRKETKGEVHKVDDKCGIRSVCGSIRDFLVDMMNVNVKIIVFVWCLSKEMWILWLTSFIGFIAGDSFVYFFTTFIGESIYGGDPRAPQDTEAYQNYVEGVRMGSWGLAAGSALLAIASVFQDKLADWMGLKGLYIAVQCLFVLATFGLALHTLYGDNMVLITILGSLTGPYIGLFLSIPYTLVYEYEVC